MKIGFTGTREGMSEPQRATLKRLLDAISIEEAHHGDCIGADDEFVAMLSRRGDKNVLAKIVSHPPLIGLNRARSYADVVLPAKEYLTRNRDIVDACDVLFAAPKERVEQARGGTWYTIRYAAKVGKPVWIILPDGELARGV